MKIKLNKKQFKYLLPKKKYCILVNTTIEYRENWDDSYNLDMADCKDTILITYTPNILCKIGSILLFIPYCFYYGLSNIGELYNQTLDTLKGGALAYDTVSGIYESDDEYVLRFREIVEGKGDNIK